MGPLWQLDRRERELDANLVRLPPGGEVGEHQERMRSMFSWWPSRAAGGSSPVTVSEPLTLTPSTVT